ncbi:hypothetical protein ACLB2K_001218 [Fragaria x ananassa]
MKFHLYFPGHKPPSDWTAQDDTELVCAVEKYGEKQWYRVRELLSRRRKAGDCKTRWEEYIRPILLQDTWTPTDDCNLLFLGDRLRPQWTTVASNFSFLKTPLRCQQRYEALRTAPVDKPKASTDPKVAETGTHGPQKPSTPRTGHNHKERLVARLKKVSRKELPVAGDGNCLVRFSTSYRALSHQLYGDEKHYRYVKELVIAQLRSCPALYTCFFNGDYGKLVSDAAKDGAWAPLLAFQRNIVMVGNEQDRESYVFTPQRKAVPWETLWITYHNSHCNSTVKDDME